MKTKHIFFTAITALVCAFTMFSCTNLIEDLKGKLNPNPTPDPVSSDPYIIFKGNEAFSLSVSEKHWNGRVDYSKNSTDWINDWDGTTPISSQVGSDGKHYVYLRGKNNTTFYDNSSYDATCIQLSGSDDLKVECNGNIMTLLNYENPGIAEMGDCCFESLFSGCDKLIKAPSLPATKLSFCCYYEMFSGCELLETAPALPATNLQDYCYYSMFEDCAGLKTAPVLPATKLKNYCYSHMFNGCTSLKNAPVLPATKLADGCYYSMFEDCEELLNAPALPVTELKAECYYLMFSGCTKLKAAPDLPATELTEDCYGGMFRDCAAIKSAPALPATELKERCYWEMFGGCESLTVTPALPATVLAEECYRRMFVGCTNLVKIGKIGNGTALTVSANTAMEEMFRGCSELKIIETTAADEDKFISFGTISGTDPVEDMFDSCKSGSVVTPEENKSYKVEPPFVPSNYLTFEGNETFTLGISDASTSSKKAWNGKVYYSTNKTVWKEWNKSDASTIASSAVSDGKAYIYLAGTGNTGFSTTDYRGDLANFTKLSLSGSATDIKCTGNIMTLLDSENPNSATMGKYCFAKLFEGCTKLSKAPSLPATALASCCYEYMFSGCTSLVNAPSLPATTLTDSCYQEMFSGCTALTEAPVLNATTLADYCYYGMFARCSSLAAAPLLPATVLARECYFGMFKNCTLLESSPELPAEHAEYYCYRSMFQGCTSLTTVGKIHMTDFGGGDMDKEGGIDCMFFDCTSLSVYEIDKDEGSTSMSGVFLLPFTDDEYFLSVFENCNKINFSDITSYHYYKYVIE